MDRDAFVREGLDHPLDDPRLGRELAAGDPERRDLLVDGHTGERVLVDHPLVEDGLGLGALAGVDVEGHRVQPAGRRVDVDVDLRERARERREDPGAVADRPARDGETRQRLLLEVD